MKRYPVEMGWVVEPTDEDGIAAIVSEIDGEEVVLASDYDALLADAKRLRDALDHTVWALTALDNTVWALTAMLTGQPVRDAFETVDEANGVLYDFRERWLQEDT
jgi:hypothetical protein